MEPHFAAVGFWKLFAGNDFEEKHEFQSIAEVLFDILDLSTGLTKMAVAPGREGLCFGKG